MGYNWFIIERRLLTKRILYILSRRHKKNKGLTVSSGEGNAVVGEWRRSRAPYRVLKGSKKSPNLTTKSLRRRYCLSCSLNLISFCAPPSPNAELLEDVLREQPQEADGIDSVVVVDNVPQVGPDRLEKLKNVIHKIFSKFGKITNEFYPEADGKTKG